MKHLKRFSHVQPLLIALLVAGTGVAGCSANFSGDEPTDSTTKALMEAAAAAQKEPAARTSVAPSQNTSSIEVLWQVPGEAVEKYHLYYGFDPAHLDNHVEIPVADLQKVDNPKHGPVFRYELKQIPSNKALYLSLRAENRSGVSDPSSPTKVEPGQTSVTP